MKKNDDNIYRVFLWGWCSMCGPYIKCPKCGNNTCNGGFGNEDGSPIGTPAKAKCDVCNLAYQYSHTMFKYKKQPKTKKEIKKINKLLIQEHDPRMFKK